MHPHSERYVAVNGAHCTPRGRRGILRNTSNHSPIRRCRYAERLIVFVTDADVNPSPALQTRRESTCKCYYCTTLHRNTVHRSEQTKKTVDENMPVQTSSKRHPNSWPPHLVIKLMASRCHRLVASKCRGMERSRAMERAPSIERAPSMERAPSITARFSYFL